MKKKIAVLHSQIPFMRGGAEILVETLVKKLNEFGYNAELVSMPFRWYPENGLYDNMLSWDMLDLTEMNGEKIDLVIPTKFPTYGVHHPNKVVWLMHQHRAAYDLSDNVLHSGFDTIKNGQRMKAVVQNYDNIKLPDAKKIYTISKNVSCRLSEYNGISSSELYHPPGLEGRYFCESYDDFILSVGRLDPLKRVDLLLKAVALSDKKISVKIAGKGPELENLKKLARKLNIAERVQFLGFVNDEQLLELYSRAFAVYFAPIDEDYGYITLEAFLSKKPVITCCDSGGVLEFVKHEISGYVCETNPDDVGDAIMNLYNDKNKCECLGNNGYKVVKNISWKNVIDKLTFNI